MRLRPILLCLMVAGGFSCSLIRHMDRVQPGLVSDPQGPPAELIASVPFLQFTGGVLVVRGRVNDLSDTLNFILDTGSGGISLDSLTCVQLGLPVTSSDRFIRGIGGTKRLFYAAGNSLQLPGLHVDSLDFHISDYSFISSVYGVPIDGIIGYSFLKQYIVQVNYDSMKLFIYTPGRYIYEPGGDLMTPYINNIPVIPAGLRNKAPYSTKYYFDMGAGLCLMLSNRFVTDSCIFCQPGQRKHKFIQTEAQGLTGKITMVQTVVQGLKVGPYYFRKVPTYLFDDVSNVTAYPSLGGLIGNDLLRRFNVTLNYPQNQIYLNPNKHFNEPFDYSYTGLVMYFIDDHVLVTGVMRGSPAEKAGFEPGDIIVAVNRDFSNHIQRYRELLKATGTKAQIIINRDGVLQEMKLPIKSIL